MFYLNPRTCFLLSALLAVTLLLVCSFPAHGQGGSPDTDALRHLQLAQIYEQAEDWDQAISEYQAATVATTPEYRQAAFEGLRRVLYLRDDPWANLWRQRRQPAVLLGLASTVLILLILISYWRSARKRRSLLIAPFTDMVSQSKEMGSGIADTIANTLHQAQLIHGMARLQRTTIMSEEIDLPSFSTQEYLENVKNTINLLNSLKVADIGLPIGSVLQSTFTWWMEGRQKIVGSLQKYGNRYQLTARLEEGRGRRTTRLWQVSDEFAPEMAGDSIGTLAQTLAFEILLGLDKGWGTRSAKGLEQFTRGLAELEPQHLDSGDSLALQRAVERFEEALAEDPSYYAAKYNLAAAYIGLGQYEQAISLLEKLRLHLRRDLAPEISYNRAIAYYHLAQDWAYDFAEKEFNNAIASLKSMASAKPSLKPMHLELLALAHCGLASTYAQRVGRDKEQARTHFEKTEENVLAIPLFSCPYFGT